MEAGYNEEAGRGGAKTILLCPVNSRLNETYLVSRSLIGIVEASSMVRGGGGVSHSGGDENYNHYRHKLK